MSSCQSSPDADRRRARKRRRRLRRIYIRTIQITAILLLMFGVYTISAPLFSHHSGAKHTADGADTSSQTGQMAQSDPLTLTPAYTLHTTAKTVSIEDSFPSQYAVLVDLESGEIIAQRNSDVRMNPASMTKLLTLLVATEHIQDTQGVFTMTRPVADFCFTNKCSVVGFEVGEQIPIQELFYGCILCSGADACLGLADLAAGSHEAFVELMNEKVAQLGLADTTHFTNCVGIYDENHYCTVRDMAMILKAALENEACREILFTKVFESAPTPEHPKGQVLSNWFLRRIEGRETGAITVRGAKTGYVGESGFCAASYGEDANGHGYLCVTGNSHSTQQTVNDHAALYRTYCSPT